LFVDANIFLEVELSQTRSNECEDFLKKVDAGELKAFTSDFVIDSIVIIMESKGVDISKILRFLLAASASKGLSIYNHTFNDRILAVNAMIKENLTFDDAMVTVAIRALNIERIVSFDSHFNDVKKIKRIEPRDLI
jgi:predicted nucleic acid-binding protein